MFFTFNKSIQHARNFKKINGKEPTHLTASSLIVESIPFYTEEIERLNDEVSETISAIEISKEVEKERYKSMMAKDGKSLAAAFDASQFKHLETFNGNDNSGKPSEEITISEGDHNRSISDLPTPLLDNHEVNKSPLYAVEEQSIATEVTDVETVDGKQSQTAKPTKTKNSIQATLMKTAKGIKKSANIVQEGVLKSANVVQKTVNLAQDGALNTMSGVKGIGAMSIQVATNLIWGSEDGQVRDGGFVTFSTLSAKASCAQMIHHQVPFSFQVSDAPLPQAIFWNNVGLSHRNQQLGFVTAQVLTGTLCIFWTIPVTFITSLAEVSSLKKEIPNLATAIKNYPWIEPLLSQLNPILLMILKILVPIILSKFSEREGHVSQNALNASVLTKLAIFLVSQGLRYYHMLKTHNKSQITCFSN